MLTVHSLEVSIKMCVIIWYAIHDRKSVSCVSLLADNEMGHLTCTVPSCVTSYPE